MINENKRVLLGMSGGTDSSVAAMRLKDQGYDVTGVTFRFYELNGSTEYLDDARELADKLQIKHITYDAREVFNQQIVCYFVDEYMRGHTPVPCTLCNNHLKWPLLAQIADEMGIYYLSTGHYIRKTKICGSYYITSAVDTDKDQSFFLWGLKQDILRRILLPMGDVTKVEARAYASEKGFLKMAVKRDSLGVCFCPMDYHSFLKSWLKEKNEVQIGDSILSPSSNGASVAAPSASSFLEAYPTIKRGKFVDENGKFISWHDGYPFYTIGQRRGLHVHLNKPIFVKEINPQRNEVVLSSLKSLEKTEMFLKDWNIVDESMLLNNPNVIVKIRYRKQSNFCMVTRFADNLLHVQLYEPLTAIALGQAAAFYKDGLLLGGGIIAKA